MSGRAFFDTNIMIYLYADDEQEKQAISRGIVNNAAECVISTQILNEINNVMIKNGKYPPKRLRRCKEMCGV